jgi:hypothetical protein
MACQVSARDATSTSDPVVASPSFFLQFGRDFEHAHERPVRQPSIDLTQFK